MKDLTQGPVIRHLLHMAAFLAVSMLVQTLYMLADLYWVGRLGKEAIAAVGVAGNLMMLVLALTQMLGVGTTATIAQAAGRKDQPHAERAFNQSLVMSVCIAVLFGVVGMALRDFYCASLTADRVTAALAKSYLNWFIPALLLQSPLTTLGSALRATGIVKPAVGLQVLSVVLNIILAPLFIFGIGPWPRMGVAGAGLATFISILVADILTLLYFETKYRYLRLRLEQWRPQMAVWWAMLKIGLPAGAEFVLFSVYMFVVYAIIRQFGAAAQAGFGIGARVMQAMFLPVVALSFAISPVVGQNFGGRRAERVRQSVLAAMGIASGMMAVLTVLGWAFAPVFIRGFTRDPQVISFGAEYLSIVSFNFLASGIVFSSSSVFQGLGNTLPPLLSTSSRLLLFAVPALLVSQRAGFQIRQVWYLSVMSQVLQACLNLSLLRRELGRKLKFEEVPIAGPVAA
ncbi:MAG: MATE family efflux transporter [Chthoniobacterales bacterium]|nr:MAG: MATE family efflux transporter [Chthoniobacterales bacterium]